MALERTLNLPANSIEVPNLSNLPSSIASRLHEELCVGNVKYETALQYITGTNPDEQSAHLGTAASVFEAGTPGALALDEVESEINLEEWKLQFGSNVVKLQVSAEQISRDGL